MDRSLGDRLTCLCGALRRDWGPETTGLPAGTWPVVPPPTTHPAPDSRAARIVAALERGRRVALEADGPIDALAADTPAGQLRAS